MYELVIRSGNSSRMLVEIKYNRAGSVRISA